MLPGASPQKMTEMQEALYQVEAFLNENYRFRRNVLNGKVEINTLTEKADEDTDTTSKDTETTPDDSSTRRWNPVTPQVINSIVRHAKKEGIGGDKTPRQNIEEFIGSDAIEDYDPIHTFLDNLPAWDGHNHVADLFGRIPGITTEQLAWCATWLRSAVAHWLNMDILHGNECVPILIGKQGCGKSTFAIRLLPEELREYYLDHINFSNKFDSEMALTHNLLVNIDEFDRIKSHQQSKLKQMLSKVKVNGRPIFGRTQEDRRRYASFLATTNDRHPLHDTTGSRRYICLLIREGLLIDNRSPIDYGQLYAQVLHELRTDGTPHWFSTDEVQRIQYMNAPFLHTDDIESMLFQCFRLPENPDEGEWFTGSQVCQRITKLFPSVETSNTTKIRIGQTLKYLGCKTKHTKRGVMYRLISTTGTN